MSSGFDVDAVDAGDAVLLVEPTALRLPIVVDSPHSGFHWPSDARAAASEEALRSTWDAFVEELWGDAAGEGATLISSPIARAYIDLNRDVRDIDAALLAEAWYEPLQPTAYTERGMGLIRRFALPGVPMYDSPLSVVEVRRRIERWYSPYRRSLGAAIDRCHSRFGVCCHLNVHSMKSQGNAMNVDAGAVRADVVVSDRHGTTAAPAHTLWIAEWFRQHGLTVTVNTPYAGGDLVRTFGAPTEGRHSVQIELNRALYMDEQRLERHDGFPRLRNLCRLLVREFGSALLAQTSHHPDA